jgi:hypothetical protein
MKNSAAYVICIQADAASPQGHDRIWCSALTMDFLEILGPAGLAALSQWGRLLAAFEQSCACENFRINQLEGWF